MDDLSRLEAKGVARAKTRSKRRRVSAIRRRTIRGSLALFAISWAIVFGQLVSGNDPALSHTPKPLATPRSGERAAPAPVQSEPELEEEGAVAPVESEPPPEIEPAPEAEPAPEPEPEPIVTSAS